jgi:hypothetical protein
VAAAAAVKYELGATSAGQGMMQRIDKGGEQEEAHLDQRTSPPRWRRSRGNGGGGPAALPFSFCGSRERTADPPDVPYGPTHSDPPQPASQ